MALWALVEALETETWTRHPPTLIELLFKGAEIHNTQMVLHTGWEYRKKEDVAKGGQGRPLSGGLIWAGARTKWLSHVTIWRTSVPVRGDREYTDDKAPRAWHLWPTAWSKCGWNGMCWGKLMDNEFGEKAQVWLAVLINYSKKLGGLEKGIQVCMFACDWILIDSFSVVSIFD